MKKNKKMKLSKKKIVIISSVLILLCAVIIFLIVFNKDEKINDNFALAKEEYKINDKKKTIDLNIEIKNISSKTKEIDNITVKVLNQEGQQVFYYYKNVDKDIKKDGKYNLEISGSIENSGISNKKDIKDIEYEIN